MPLNFWLFVLLILVLLWQNHREYCKSKKDRILVALKEESDAIWWQLIKAIERQDEWETDFYRNEVIRLARLRMEIHFKIVALRPSMADDRLVSSCSRLIREMDEKKKTK